ncbi:putative transcriptional regulator [Acidovorax sp. CF316]|uniref:MerR family DNA-binding transcriptional regulator n=1 Tax=Acidovorax sp. CF316 TaxID=1144317 RepID=UPI00026BEAB5|nr:MerR family DNA-binding transcriptional regulator [Acidovorax sp. CF316]EJE48695.1 putative transcriptional regulator [Acidovorax sp. CF316]
MQISELARRTSVSVHALRHYESQGLLQPERRPNGYRDYAEGSEREVVFIAMSRQLGFALPRIAEHLADFRSGRLTIAAMVQALQQRAQELADQAAVLQAQRQKVLEHMAWLQARAPSSPSSPPSASSPAAPWPRVRRRVAGLPSSSHRSSP